LKHPDNTEAAEGGHRGQPKSMYPERRAFDRLLVPLTARCMNAPLGGLDAEIEKGLKDVADFFGCDRALLWELSEDGRVAELTHYHAEAGAEPPTKTLLHETLPYIFDSILGLKNLCVSDLDDLPRSAAVDRQYLEHAGIRSFLVIPLLVGGNPRGILSLACLREERSWTNADLFSLQRIGTVVASALDRKRSHRLLELRMRFETLLADLSANIIKATVNEIDAEIERSLARVTEFFGADRGGLLRIDADRRTIHISHAFYAEGVPHVSPDVEIAALFPWCFEELVARKRAINVTATQMAELPPEAEKDRQSWAAMGVRSNLTIPLYAGASLEYLIVIHSLREERAWSEEYIPRLRLLGELFVNALNRKQADESVKTSEERFREFFKNTPDYCYIIDPEGTILSVNHAVLRTLGYEREELVGGPLAKIYAPESLPKMEELLARWKKEGHIENEEMVIMTKGGGKRLVLLNAGAVRDDQGRILYSTSVQTDITEQRQFQDRIQAAADEWHRTFNTIQDLIMILDRDFRIVQMNDAAMKFFELPEGQIIGAPCYRLMHGTEHPMDGCPYEKVQATKRHEETDVYDESRGLWFHIVVDPLLDEKGELTGVVHTVKDITARKQAEEEIRKAYAEIAALKDKLEAENIYLREEIGMSREEGAIVGQSDAIKYVLFRIDQVAPQDITVLIVGETGTGKGLVARAVHEGSRRRDLPMIHVNCAGLPANLIESELFGREKGAFTGAQARQIGRFELAHKGTLFLDEIAELPVELQAKLLRVIDTGEFERLGSPHTIKVDVRIIAATNRNLAEEIRKGRFREDLFYRLNVFPITVPPLRQRTEDIPLMVSALVERMNKQMGKCITTVPREVEQLLKSYAWPGNVRELENIIGRAVITTPGSVLRLADGLGDGTLLASEQREATVTGLRDVERSHIMKTLEALKWKIEGPNGAAHALGLKPSTLRTRLQKLNIRRPTNS